MNSNNNTSIDAVMTRLLEPAGLGEQQLSTTLGGRGGLEFEATENAPFTTIPDALKVTEEGGEREQSERERAGEKEIGRERRERERARARER